MVRKIQPFQVVPALPANLEPLVEIAYNLRWTWDRESILLFRRMDQQLWESSGHNPIRMLGTLSQSQLDQLSKNSGFLAHLGRVKNSLDDYMGAETWFARTFPDREETRPLVSYFSFEYGITECLQIYSGGLGILAGDHLKSASDLGIPLVGVGLLYQGGYFRQYVNRDGWQQEVYPRNDFYNLPVRLVRDGQGNQVVVSVPFPGREVHAALWYAQVGRVRLYFLDTSVPRNTEADRFITSGLYNGDRETRIQQEILLGAGGVYALEALGLTPSVFHMNEGHAAFLTFGRVQILMEKGVKPFDAMAAVRASCVFTTHTPVPAGIDMFEDGLMRKYFTEPAARLGIPVEALLALGHGSDGGGTSLFNMAYLAIRLAAHCNGVSRLHGEVSRKLFSPIWPELPVDEIPITSITNGVHAASWVSLDLAELFDRYMGIAWRDDHGDDSVWGSVAMIPNEELWRLHERRRDRLISFARRRLVKQLQSRGAGAQELARAREVLDPRALTIGFARRFATYKRATLLLKDRDRLRRLLLSDDRPVQFIFAGKAHPQDNDGKALIKEIVSLGQDPDFRNRVVFLEDYDMVVSRYMLSGCDVWLNTPRRPMEASGTSGMKAAMNGVLNCSILDGWWIEGYGLDPEAGWAIGRGETYTDLPYQDQVESNALYELLEREIVPTFYTRSPGGLPVDWIQKMKVSIGTLSAAFNTNRMVRDYATRFYVPAERRAREFSADGHARAHQYRKARERIRAGWGDLEIVRVVKSPEGDVAVKAPLQVKAWVKLGSLTAEAVDVQIYYGQLDPDGSLIQPAWISMTSAGTIDDLTVFEGQLQSSASGLHGFTIRILPKYEDLLNPYEWNLVHWQQ
ncbi:MAG: Glycogen phosphorylase [Thermoanaerobaculia bacterium]|nr:Glycogen phosphorylase [Thermoanaerobaculia bacterium]